MDPAASGEPAAARPAPAAAEGPKQTLQLPDLGLTLEAAHDPLRPALWQRAWGAGHVLGNAVQAAVTSVSRAAPAAAPPTVLDVGAGIGIVGLAAAKANATCTVTDVEPAAVAAILANAERNGVAVHAQPMSFRDPTSYTAHAGAFDVVVGSDVLFLGDNMPHVAACTAACVAPGGVIAVCDPGRPCAADFADHLSALGFRVYQRVAHNVEFAPGCILKMARLWVAERVTESADAPAQGPHEEEPRAAMAVEILKACREQCDAREVTRPIAIDGYAYVQSK